MELKLGYLGLSLLMIVMLILLGNTAIDRTFDKSQKVKKLGFLIGGLLGWQIYMFLIAKTGMLTDFSFPPRFVLFMILPAFIFIGIFIYRNRNNDWIQNIPSSWLIYYQTFRILIETLFVYSVAAGVLHPNVTIEGYNFDMIFACTAPVVGLLIYQFKALPEKFALWWNYLGLLVIASIIATFQLTIYFPEVFGPDTAPFPTDFGLFPYVEVPGFLMPSAVFVHVLSIVQLKGKLNKGKS